MDWLRQIPMGQFVDGREGWLRRLDARLKLAWSLVFLLTPVLAGPLWRVALVLGLLLLPIAAAPLRRAIGLDFQRSDLRRQIGAQAVQRDVLEMGTASL